MKDIYKKYAELLQEKKEIEQDLKECKEEIAELEPLVLNKMAEDQMTRITLNLEGESATLHTHTMVWARPKGGNKQAVIDALASNPDLADLVSESYNTAQLSAYVREVLSNNATLDPVLAAALQLDEVITCRARFGSLKESKSKAALRNQGGNQ
jgi:hypothetical protein